MDGKTFARISAAVFVGIAITATAIQMTRKEEAPASQPSRQVAEAAADPLRAALIRCQLLGEAGPRDPACLRAWAENRQRFMAPGARAAERLPDMRPAPADGAVIDNDPIRKETAPVTTPQASEAQ